MQQQRESVKDMADIQNESVKRDIDYMKLANDRYKTAVDAEKAGADVSYKQVQTAGVQIDNATKLRDAFDPMRMVNR